MSTIVPLSKERHAAMYWNRARDWTFASGKALVPIVSLELSRAVASMPLAFIPDSDNRYQLVAVLGTEPQRSLAVDTQGRWRPGHYPMMMATYPFVLVDGQEGNQFVAIDESSGLVGTDPDSGEAFFTEEGEPTELVTQVVENLKTIAAARLHTRQAAAALDEAGLIKPWELTLSGTRMEGLFCLDEARLRTLEPAMLKNLQDAGALAIAYGQLFSMSRVELLNAWSGDADGTADTGFSLVDETSYM